MPRRLRVIRGMVGVGLTFAVGVGIVASLVFALPSWLILGGEAGREALGAGGGLVLFGLLAANAWQAWSVSTAIANAAILVFLGSGSATATLLIARKAGPALTSGDESRRLGEG